MSLTAWRRHGHTVHIFQASCWGGWGIKTLKWALFWDILFNVSLLYYYLFLEEWYCNCFPIQFTWEHSTFFVNGNLVGGGSGVGKMLNFNWLIGVHDMFKLKRLSPNFKDQGRFKGGFLQSSRNVLVYIKHWP